jgi:acyl-[acyl-carrier-protein]-phospholipid O-acyltransferase/long-chain-fatty-acid--[acyl-carrier-protein] ligase
VQVSSFIAIIITSLITLSYYLGYFEMAFVATLLLAAQSAFYSPAKYGLIKEMFGTANVVKANSITQAITIIAILLGAVIYSIFFESLLIGDVNNKDEILKMVAPIGFVLIISSVFEFLLSLKLPTTKTKKITDNFAIKKYLTGMTVFSTPADDFKNAPKTATTICEIAQKILSPIMLLFSLKVF